jgi:Pyruvate/2-oxoacid:ferredoxin oxidoreductase delta subunit
VDTHSAPNQFVFAIDAKTCIECGTCRRFCPVPKAVFIDVANYQHTIDADLCTGCGLCVPFCPAAPQTIYREPVREIRTQGRLRNLRRAVWRNKWHYETHPIMGPLTAKARRALRTAE